MGIAGLLHGAKSVAQHPCQNSHQQHNIRDYAHQSVAVDCSSWLYKSIYSIADHYVETVESTGTIDARSIAVASKYILTRCDELLRGASIKRVYLVMDGVRCPLKCVTNDERERKRQLNLQAAREFKRTGNRDDMYEKYKSCIRVKAELGETVADAVLRKYGNTNAKVQIVWSPFEADAQLVKLCVDGLAHAIVTEDSDVLVYAATCHCTVPIIFKLDRYTGSCEVMSMAWLLDSDTQLSKQQQLHDETAGGQKKTPGLDAFLHAFAARQVRTPGRGVRLFVQACVLAGCDYCPNQLNGVGTVTAFKHVRNALHRDSDVRFQQVLQSLSLKSKQPIVNSMVEYERLLSQSEAVFYYHPVRDSVTGRVVFLNDLEGPFERPSLDRYEGDWSFLGDLNARFPHGVDCSQAQQSLVIPIASSKQAPNIRASAHEIIRNPYLRRSRIDQIAPRSPLQPKSPNERLKKRKNPFALFGHGTENSVDNKVVSTNPMLDAYRSGQDVRFVKRIFPRDGSRAATSDFCQKPVSGVVQRPSVSEVIDVDNSAIPTPGSEQMAKKSAFFCTNQVHSRRVTLQSLPDPRHTLGVTSRQDFLRKQQEKIRAGALDAPPDPRDELEEPSRSPHWAESLKDPILDSPPDPLDFLEEPSPMQSGAQEYSQDHLQPGLQIQNSSLLVPAKFDFYDDFLSPRKNDVPPVDEIVDLSPDSPVHGIAVSTRRQSKKPGPTVGPAKTILFRFGMPFKQKMAEPSVHGGVQKGQPASSTRSLFRNSRPNACPQKQTTLLSHFAQTRSRK
jgi:5'-3' exonuclease